MASLFSNYGVLILLLGGVFGGEEIIIGLVFLSLMGLFPLWWIFIFVTAGEFIADFLIFMFGRLHTIEYFKKKDWFARMYDTTDMFIKNASRDSIFRTLLYSKFMYGTRIIALLYVGSKKESIRKFVVAEGAVLVVWMSVAVVVGWLAGTSANQFKETFKHVEVLVGVFFILLVAVTLGKKWLQTKLRDVLS